MLQEHATEDDFGKNLNIKSRSLIEIHAYSMMTSAIMHFNIDLDSSFNMSNMSTKALTMLTATCFLTLKVTSYEKDFEKK